jgi:hypothetical protein
MRPAEVPAVHQLDVREGEDARHQVEVRIHDDVHVRYRDLVEA